jgi:choline transport protein
VLPKRFFDLGRLGLPINITAVAWVVFLDILYCFPTTLPATPQNMSYVSVVAAALVAFVIGLWFTTKRGTFTGPRVDMELLNERRDAAIRAESIGGVEVVEEYVNKGQKHAIEHKIA